MRKINSRNCTHEEVKARLSCFAALSRLLANENCRPETPVWAAAQGREYKGYVPGFPQASVMHCSSACIRSGCISKKEIRL